MLTSEQREEFREQGFLVVRGALDPETDLHPLCTAYPRLFDRLAPSFLADAPDLLHGWERRPFPEKIAVLAGASRGLLFDHLDPLLRLHRMAYRRRRDLPSPYLPELFEAMRNERILDIVENLVGPEISVSPGHHVHFKLGRQQLALMREVLLAQPPGRSLDANLFDFHLDRSHWHADTTYGQPDSWDSGLVVVWIPLTEATRETSALCVLPRSHREAFRAQNPEASGDGVEVAIETFPGDLVLFDYHLQHASTQNRSEDRMRWCFNFRYLPSGKPDGRPHLPSFVARSRANPGDELRDAELWAAMWERALDCVRWYQLPASTMGRISIREAEANTRRWNERIGEHRDWLELEEPGVIDRFVRQPSAALGRILRRLGS